MGQKIVDLSIYLENDVISDPRDINRKSSTLNTPIQLRISPIFSPALPQRICPMPRAGQSSKLT